MMWRAQGPLTPLSALAQAFEAECIPRWYSTVVSWGRNLEGQAGIEGTAVVTRPTPILELHDQALTNLAASKLTSAAVTHTGELYTWGDGWGGKLGHGSGDSLIAPTRVESLVSKARMTNVALGDHHSLLLDSHGHVWACGENKEGQCGFGTPMEVIAQQRHQSYAQLQEQHAANTLPFMRVNPPAHQAAASYDDSAGAVFSRGVTALLRSSDGLPASVGRVRRRRSAARSHLETLWSAPQHQASSLHGNSDFNSSRDSNSSPHGPWLQGMNGSSSSSGHSLFNGQLISFGRQGASWGTRTRAANMRADPASALLWGGLDLSAYLTGAGAQPGHQCIPARLGRDLHPLAHPGSYSDLLDDSQISHSSFIIHGDDMCDSHTISELTSERGAQQQNMGISGQHVLQVATSRHFSLAVTTQGQVWAWGACFDGCLGPHNHWATAPQRLDGELAAVIEDEGGAVSVAAAGTFALAITRSGKAVVWGSLPAVQVLTSLLQPNADAPSPQPAYVQAFLSSLRLTGHASKQRAKAAAEKVRVRAGIIQGLPPIMYIAAGQQHAVLSDGERVWVLGKCVDSSGKATLAAPWNTPLEVFDASSLGGVKCVRAGAHSSAVITGNGQLWMWGRLMDAQHASMLLKRAGGAPRLAPWQDVGSLMWEDSSLWKWSGFGAAKPTHVTGLPGPVRDVALGGWHAMALVD